MNHGVRKMMRDLKDENILISAELIIGGGLNENNMGAIIEYIKNWNNLNI